MRLSITQGKWRPGMRLPSEDALCRSLRVSRGTLRNALAEIERDGLIIRRHGIGTFVRERPLLRNNLNIILGITEMIRSMGMIPGLASIQVLVENAEPVVAANLQCEAGDEVIRIDRVYTGDSERLVYCIDYFCEALLGNVEAGLERPEAIKEYLVENLSLLKFLRQELRLALDHSSMRLCPLNAPRGIASLLEIAPGKAIIFLEEVIYDPAENPLAYSQGYYTGEAALFTVSRLS